MGLNVLFMVFKNFKNLAKYLVGTKTVFNFAVQTASQKPGQGQVGGSTDIIRKRLSALILDEQEFFPLFAGRQQIQTSTLFPYEHPGRTLSGLNHNVTLWHYSNTSTMKNRHMPRPRRCNIPHPNPTPRLSSPAILFTQSSDRHSYSSY